MGASAEQLYERVLVLRCQGGDEAAFTELVERYSPRLRYFLRKLLGDTGNADDTLQDVWIDVFRNVARLADPAALAAWLYRIARDRAYRQLRRCRSVPQPLDEIDLPAADASDDLLAVEEAQAIHRALDHLVEEHREVLVLRFLEDLSYDAIAQVTAIPVGTVRSRLHHAKRALRAALLRMDRHGG